MELLPIIYTSLLIVGALALAVVIFSYAAFKVKKVAQPDEKEKKKEVPHQVKVLIKKSKERAAELEKRKKGSSSKDQSPQQPKLSDDHYKRKKSFESHHRKVKRLEVLNPTMESHASKQMEKDNSLSAPKTSGQNHRDDIISKYEDD